MFQTNTNKELKGLSIHAMLEDLAAPLLLFSLSMFVLLALSRVLILPRFTSFHRSDGIALNPREIAEYRNQLAADVAKQEENRARLVLPIQDSTYDKLKEEKRSLSIAALHEQLSKAALRLGEADGSIVITKLGIDNGQATVEGDVRNVGPRSMTVLAALTEQIEKLPIVHDLKRPAFVREQEVDGTFHSPFVLSFTLHD
jgi:hypothetical protein